MYIPINEQVIAMLIIMIQPVKMTYFHNRVVIEGNCTISATRIVINQLSLVYFHSCLVRTLRTFKPQRTLYTFKPKYMHFYLPSLALRNFKRRNNNNI